MTFTPREFASLCIGIALGTILTIASDHVHLRVDHATLKHDDPAHEVGCKCGMDLVKVYEQGQHIGQVRLCAREHAACYDVAKGWTALPPGNTLRCDVPADGCGQAVVPR